MKVTEPVEAEEDDSFGGELQRSLYHVVKLITPDMSAPEPLKVTSSAKAASKTAPRPRKEEEEEESARPMERKGPSGESSKKLISVSWIRLGDRMKLTVSWRLRTTAYANKETSMPSNLTS